MVVAVALVALNLRLFLFPSTSTPAHADAVVVLAGGDGERLDKGLELVRDGVAPNLVVSTGPDELCGTQHDFEVYCFLPDPDDTRGEAEAIGRIAAREGWHHLVLVTSDYHATRAPPARRTLLLRAPSTCPRPTAARGRCRCCGPSDTNGVD